jgi:PAS domain S-box-containing protein
VTILPSPSIDGHDQYRTLVEHSPNLLSRHTHDGVFLYASPACLGLTGYSPSDLIGHSMYEFVHQQDYDRVRYLYSGLQSRMAAQDIEYRLRSKSGNYLWLKSATRVVHSDEQPEVLLFTQNITPTKHMEEALQILARWEIASTPDDFFRPLLAHITSALLVSYAFVTETRAENTRVRMLAFWKGKDFALPYEYGLDDTPCDLVIHQEKICTYPVGVQALFPKDQDLVALNAQGYVGVPIMSASGKDVIGHLAVLDNRPLKLSESQMAILKLFAARASREIEHLRAQTERGG